MSDPLLENTNGEAIKEENNELYIDYSHIYKHAKIIEEGIDSISSALVNLSRRCAKENISRGITLVFGIFDSDEGKVYDVCSMGSNPIKGFQSIYDDDFEEKLFELASGDGAVIINRTGQILGAKVYLRVDNPNLLNEEDLGTRHRAAASFSKKPNVIRVFTLSEETLTVRVWNNGTAEDEYTIEIEADKNNVNIKSPTVSSRKRGSKKSSKNVTKALIKSTSTEDSQ